MKEYESPGIPKQIGRYGNHSNETNKMMTRKNPLDLLIH